jgi:dienelactone hydrolase
MDLHTEDIMDEFFKYDDDLPLEAVVADSGDAGNSPEYYVTYASVHDQRVTALLTLPSDVSPPFPTVLILHGVFGHKTSYNQLKRSASLVAAGFATLRIDGQYSGERQVNFAGGVGLGQFYYRNRDAMVQTAIDLMRGVDYLASRSDIDMRRIGFAGFSMGGAVGALFCAHDPRVKAVALGITGGDFRALNLLSGNTAGKDRMLRAYRAVDPVFCVSRISPRPLLMLNALHDQIVPRAATEALFEAAREPKKIIWYDCGHADLPERILDDMTGFFDAELRK